MSRNPLRVIWIFLAASGLIALYTALFDRTPRGFTLEFSDSMFLWGLTLLCISSVYLTNFFGFLHYFQNWFRFRPAKPAEAEAFDGDATDNVKRDPSLLYASLLLLLFSVLVSFL
ncbi:hypothetical protein EFBL_0015 [Effusibacillus lacus]|uniref:DUF3899 domain-containing protein n=2 Tax=Effusibacillus lacus TaxID=1348429 RepID=A0A292YHJ1_9BACL|nr:hypothetical protein EFBL_0015 [Effusibacillus lacus]